MRAATNYDEDENKKSRKNDVGDNKKDGDEENEAGQTIFELLRLTRPDEVYSHVLFVENSCQRPSQ